MTDHIESLPFMPMWVKDFLTSRNVVLMTTEEKGAYLLLLFSQWMDGPIEAGDVDAIAGCQVSKRVLKCFKKTSLGLVNGKCERVKQKQLDIHNKAIAKAKKAAAARWGSPPEPSEDEEPGECSEDSTSNASSNAPGNAQALLKQCHQKQNQKQNQKQKHNQKQKQRTNQPIEPIPLKPGKRKPSAKQFTSGMEVADLFWASGEFNSLFSFGYIATAEEFFWVGWNCGASHGISQNGFCVVIAKLLELQASEKKTGKPIDNPGGACVAAIRSGQQPSEKNFQIASDAFKRARMGGG